MSRIKPAVTLKFDGVAATPWQIVASRVVIWGLWSPTSVGWMWPVYLDRRSVVITIGRLMFGAAIATKLKTPINKTIRP